MENIAIKQSLDHISICICTYKRSEMLERLLHRLEEQETEVVLPKFKVRTNIDLKLDDTEGTAFFNKKALKKIEAENIMGELSFGEC